MLVYSGVAKFSDSFKPPDHISPEIKKFLKHWNSLVESIVRLWRSRYVGTRGLRSYY